MNPFCWSFRRLLCVLVLPFAFVSAAEAFELGVGYGQNDIRYNEVITPPEKSSESGRLKSVNLTAHQASDSFEFNERAGMAWAPLHYDGTEQASPHAAVTFDHNDKFRLAEFELGYRLGDSFEFYTGAHYREWFRDLSGYQETYRWVLLPIGLRWQWIGTSHWSWILDVAARPAVVAKLKVHYIASGIDDAVLPMGLALGGRVSLPLAYFFAGENSGSALVLTPWYQRVKNSAGTPIAQTSGGAPVADASGNALAAVEPASTTQEYGIRLGLVVNF
jgi:hypothetical protein